MENRNLNKGLLEGLNDYVEYIDYTATHGYVQSGFELIDDANKGLEEAGMTLISARPNVGKTLLGQRIANKIAEQGVPVAFFTYEMNMQKLQDRFFQMYTGIPKDEMVYLKIARPDEFKLIINKLKTMKHLDNIKVFESAGFKGEDIIAEMTGRSKDVNYFVVDYIQRLTSDIQDERLAIAHNSRIIHELCINAKKQGIVLSQAGRTKDDKDSSSANKGSGNLEEDCEVGVLLSQEINEQNGQKNIQAYMYKNKNGDKCHHRYIYKIDSKLNFVKISN